jgi:hypothetical protein
MSWLRRLLGVEADGRIAKAPVAAAATGPTRVNLTAHSRRIVSIPEIDMVGERTTSPDGRYTLVWQDRFWIEGSVVEGRYVLIDGDAIVVDGRMERPQDGKVADNGTFILNDWGDSQQLSGTFHAFRSDGRTIVSRSYSANLLNNGLSRDGRLAVCQTCNAPASPDSSILTLFDLAAGAEVPHGGDRVRMLRGDRPSLDYSLAGDFLDRRLWLEDEVRRGTLYVIRKALGEGEAATGLTFEDLRKGVKAALAEGDERFEAEAWRLLGEIEESASNAGAALDAYDKALAVNPKVGVAKRAAALRKALRPA